MRLSKGLVAGAGVCLAATGSWWYSHAASAQRYQTEVARRGAIQSTVSVTGTCSAVVTVPVGSQVSGVITALYADFNSQVHKGELLAQIDPLPFEQRVRQAQAALDSAEAAVAAAKAALEKAETDIRAAQAAAESQRALVASAAAVEREAKITADRQQRLAGNSIVSDDQFESAKAAFEVAAADRESADAQERVADTTVGAMVDARDEAKVQEVSAEAQVRQAEGALEQAKLDLEHTRIVSPVDGVVISRDVNIGQTVAASFAAPELFQIAQNLAKMQVDADIDESEIAKVHVGQGAEFTVDAMPGRIFRGTIRQVRKAATNIQNVITYDAVMDVPNPDFALLPGMTANIRIPVLVRENALRVPNTALRFKPGDGKSGRGTPVKPEPVSQQKQTAQTVYVLNPAGALEPRKVQVGISDGLYTEVVSGELREGEAVILSELRSR